MTELPSLSGAAAVVGGRRGGRAPRQFRAKATVEQDGDVEMS